MEAVIVVVTTAFVAVTAVVVVAVWKDVTELHSPTSTNVVLLPAPFSLES